MTQAYIKLSDNLQNIIGQMQKIQKEIASDGQPVSMHEVDKLKQLGQQYADTVTQLAALKNSQEAQKTKDNS